MNVPRYLNRNAIMYDVLLSVSYAWGVYQAYLYDAKTKTTSMIIYLLVYGGFTLLVRSPLGILMMNLLSIVTICIFTASIVRLAPGYFDFQPLLGIVITIVVALVQGVLLILYRIMSSKSEDHKHHYLWLGIVALVFAVVLTVLASSVPVSH